jgi:hypothetical protein
MTTVTQPTPIVERIFRVQELADYIVPLALRMACELRVADELQAGPLLRSLLYGLPQIPHEMKASATLRACAAPQRIASAYEPCQSRLLIRRLG